MRSFGKLHRDQRQSIWKATDCKTQWRKLQENSCDMLTISGPQHQIQAAFELVIKASYENKKKSTAGSQATDDHKSAWSAKSPMPPGLPSPPQTLSAHLPAWQMPWPPCFEDQCYHMEPWSCWYQIHVLEQRLQTMRFEPLNIPTPCRPSRDSRAKLRPIKGEITRTSLQDPREWVKVMNDSILTHGVHTADDIVLCDGQCETLNVEVYASGQTVSDIILWQDLSSIEWPVRMVLRRTAQTNKDERYVTDNDEDYMTKGY